MNGDAMAEHIHRIRGYIKGTEALDDLDALETELVRYRDALEKIAATDGDEWYARSVAGSALDAGE